MITVIDSIMGSGKTSWAIQHVNEADYCNDRFLYITPFLDEVKRIMDKTDVDFFQPQNRGKGKLNNINMLFQKGSNIASTHELFKNFDENTRSNIREISQTLNYTLILDEVLNVIEPYTELKQGDLRILKQGGWITIDEDGFVIWNEKEYKLDSKYNDIKQLAITKSLLCINDTILLWRYPPEIFSYFKNIYILTYMFDASILKYYFDVYHIDYTVKSIILENGFYKIVDYYKPDTTKYQDLINIYEGKLNENIPCKLTSFSSSWFDTANKNYTDKLKNNIYNYFTNIINSSSKDIMWTCFKKAKNKLKGKGYTKQFVPCNCRSTNDYNEKSTLVYCCNIFFHPGITNFFSKHNLILNANKYALSEMIQWIWRSKIRNDEKINIYIPSVRMRMLLKEWLKLDDEKINEKSF
jgi:hypothetical protein